MLQHVSPWHFKVFVQDDCAQAKFKPCLGQHQELGEIQRPAVNNRNVRPHFQRDTTPINAIVFLMDIILPMIHAGNSENTSLAIQMPVWSDFPFRMRSIA